MSWLCSVYVPIICLIKPILPILVACSCYPFFYFFLLDLELVLSNSLPWSLWALSSLDLARDTYSSMSCPLWHISRACRLCVSYYLPDNTACPSWWTVITAIWVSFPSLLHLGLIPTSPAHPLVHCAWINLRSLQSYWFDTSFGTTWYTDIIHTKHLETTEQRS